MGASWGRLQMGAKRFWYSEKDQVCLANETTECKIHIFTVPFLGR